MERSASARILITYSAGSHEENNDINITIFNNEKMTKELESKLNKYKFFNHMVVSATGYCNCELCINVPAWRDGTTKTGVIARSGIIAVDPDVIPLGSVVWIEGYGVYLAEDVGSQIKGFEIDMFFDTHEEALAFGRKRLALLVIP